MRVGGVSNFKTRYCFFAFFTLLSPRRFSKQLLSREQLTGEARAKLEVKHMQELLWIRESEAKVLRQSLEYETRQEKGSRICMHPSAVRCFPLPATS
jgi:hypothetical protein